MHLNKTDPWTGYHVFLYPFPLGSVREGEISLAGYTLVIPFRQGIMLKVLLNYFRKSDFETTFET